MSTVPKSTLDAAATAPAAPPDYNRLNLNFRQPVPRPMVRGPVIDFHVHLQAARHAAVWFEAADHYGIDRFVTMTPLEEALTLQRDWPGRLQFIAVPKWGDWGPGFIDQWLGRIEAFYNIGCRIVKFWFAPPAWGDRGWRLDSEMFRPLFEEVVARRMAIMTHVGDPEVWYQSRYNDAAKYGTRDDHYAMWERLLDAYAARVPAWIGAHLGGNPENLPRLQRLLDKYPNLYFDNSATKWIIRELSAKRDESRDFVIRNQTRILFGTDQVSNDQRGFDFLASRYWVHRRFWETARTGPSPIHDPEVPDDAQPVIRGLALPDQTLQYLYHTNAATLLSRLGASF